MTEKELRNKYVATAESFAGAVRGDARHKQIIDTYNSVTPHPRGYAMTYSADWCATTVSAVAILCGMLDIFAFECSCTKQIEQWRANGRWIEDDAYVPQAGDIIYYDWSDGADYATTDAKYVDHVGIVVSCDGKTIKVIEGNMSGGKVGYRTIAVNGRYIRGFAVPDYKRMAVEPAFTDIAGNVHRVAIENAYKLGIVGGYADGTFRPNEQITRGAAAAMIMRAVDVVLKEVERRINK